MEDIAALRKEIAELRLAYAQARYFGQFQAGFLARCAHELRSPLSRALSLQQLILADLCESPAEAREFVAQAHDATKELVAMFDTILTIARLEAGKVGMKWESFPLSPVVKEVQHLLKFSLRNQNLQFDVSPIPAQLNVMGDRRYLSQALLALSEIAIFNNSHSPITLTVEPDATQQQVHIWMEWACTQPISSEPIDTLLHEPLLISSQDSSARPAISSGLRLSIAQMTLAQMNGRLELITESVPETNGERVTLRCDLPLAP